MPEYLPSDGFARYGADVVAGKGRADGLASGAGPDTGGPPADLQSTRTVTTAAVHSADVALVDSAHIVTAVAPFAGEALHEEFEALTVAQTSAEAELATAPPPPAEPPPGKGPLTSPPQRVRRRAVPRRIKTFRRRLVASSRWSVDRRDTSRTFEWRTVIEASGRTAVARRPPPAGRTVTTRRRIGSTVTHTGRFVMPIRRAGSIGARFEVAHRGPVPRPAEDTALAEIEELVLLGVL